MDKLFVEGAARPVLAKLCSVLLSAIFVASCGHGSEEDKNTPDVSDYYAERSPEDDCYFINRDAWSNTENTMYVAGYLINTGHCPEDSHGYLKKFVDGVEVSSQKVEEVNFNAVWGVDEQNVYATSWGLIIKFKGDDYTIYGRDPISAEHGYNDIWGDDAGRITVVGTEGIVLRLEDDEWNIMETPTEQDLNAVWGVDENNIYAAGNAGTLIHYDGTEWSVVETNLSENITGLWYSAYSDLYLSVGDSHKEKGPAKVIRFNGNQFLTVLSEEQGVFLSVNGANADKLHAVYRFSADNRYEVWQSSDGQVWEQAAMDEVDNFLWSTGCLSPENCYVLGSDGLLINF